MRPARSRPSRSTSPSRSRSPHWQVSGTVSEFVSIACSAGLFGQPRQRSAAPTRQSPSRSDGIDQADRRAADLRQDRRLASASARASSTQSSTVHAPVRPSTEQRSTNSLAGQRGHAREEEADLLTVEGVHAVVGAGMNGVAHVAALARVANAVCGAREDAARVGLIGVGRVARSCRRRRRLSRRRRPSCAALATAGSCRRSHTARHRRHRCRDRPGTHHMRRRASRRPSPPANRRRSPGQLSHTSPRASASAFSWPAFAVAGQLSTSPKTRSPSASFSASVGHASQASPNASRSAFS